MDHSPFMSRADEVGCALKVSINRAAAGLRTDVQVGPAGPDEEFNCYILLLGVVGPALMRAH